MRRTAAPIPVFLCLALLAGPAFAQFGPSGPPAVGTIKAETRPVTESEEFIGRIEAQYRTELRARVTGFLQERTVPEGAEVKAGDVLFRIERPPFEAQLEQARANLASAQATAANARVSLQRAQELRQTGAGTQAALDTAVAQDRTSGAAVLGAQAQVRIAEISLAYTNIIAPVDGKLGRATYTIGNVVSPTSEPLATLLSQDPMRVSFTVSQRQLLELRRRYEDRGGANAVQVRLRLGNGSDYGQTGKIEFIDPQVDRNTDTQLVRALIPNPIRRQAQAGSPGDRELVDGQFVTVMVEGIEPVQAIVIPRAAVLQDQGGTYVFVVAEGNKAERRNVTLGRSSAAEAVVEKGLNPGDTVITEGLQRVTAGQPVNPAPATPAPARPGPVTTNAGQPR